MTHGNITSAPFFFRRHLASGSEASFPFLIFHWLTGRQAAQMSVVSTVYSRLQREELGRSRLAG